VLSDREKLESVNGVMLIGCYHVFVCVCVDASLESVWHMKIVACWRGVKEVG